MDNIIIDDIIFDLSDVTLEDLKNQYIDYSLCADIVENFNNDILKELITESIQLNQTVNINVVKERLKNKYLLNEFQFFIINGSHNIKFAILVADINYNYQMVKSDMESFGYFFSHKQEKYINGMKWLILQFEPAHQETRNDILRNMNYIYHLSPLSNLNSILNNGLVPCCKNKKFSYPDRIFFIMENVTNENIIKLARKLANASQTTNRYYCLLKISVKKIPESVNFYLDPMYDYGLFTEQHIPKEAIIDVVELKI